MKKFLFAVILFLPTFIWAQSSGVYVNNIQLLNKAEKWCWSISQDNNDNMLFGVERGVIVYDGVNQELIKTAFTPLVLKNDKSNQNIWVAGSETIGVMNHSDMLRYQFKILETRKDNVFKKIFQLNDTVYFISDALILRYNAKSLEKIDEFSTKDLSIDEVVEYNGKLFFIIDYFLHNIKNNELVEVTNTDFPVDEFSYGVSIDPKTIILGTSGNTTYSFNGKTFSSFELSSPFFDNNRITNGYLYSDSTIIVSSLAGGIALLNFKTKKITKQISYFNGLPDDEIRATFIDSEKGIWVSHEFGVSRIDLLLGIECFGYYPGLKGNPIAINYFSNNLYVATNDGLFVLDEIKDYSEIDIDVPVNVSVELPTQNNTYQGVGEVSSQDNSNQSGMDGAQSKEKKGFSLFRSKKKVGDTAPTEKLATGSGQQTITPSRTMVMQQTRTIKKRSLKSIGSYYKMVDGMNGKYSQMVPFNNYLLVAGNNGLFAISNKRAETILKNMDVVNIYTTKSSSEFYCCTDNGLYKINRENGKWQINHFAETTSAKINSVAQENDGNWVIAFDNILIRAGLVNNKINVINEIELPENPGQTFAVKNINDSILAITSNKIYLFTKKGELKALQELNIDNYLIQNQNGFTWLYNNAGWKLFSNSKNIPNIGFINYLNLFNNIRYIDINIGKEMWLIDDKNQLYRLTKNLFKADTEFKISLIDIHANSEEIKISNKIKLGFGQNNISTVLSAPFYLLQNGTKFSYKIEGLNEKWTEWSNFSETNLGHLPSGSYSLYFKAKNALGIESKIGEVKISVPKPFTQTVIFYLLVLIVFIGIAYVVFKYRLKQLEKDKEILEQKVVERTATIELQKSKIEKQHDEITSSIRYAKRIQTAMLPHDEIIEAMLPNHFILFNPRDIVSGDFYFFKPLGNKIIFIAADCTGHGVPGGFMSMLGMSFLSEITSQLPAPSASEILDHLRDKIKLTLHQSDAESTQKDGMDIAVCVIDTDNKQVQFSGAFNPLYLIRDGNLEVVKADRQPVAVYIKESVFTNNIINIQPNDSFYMFSDGFADQIGGPNQRKFMAKNFKDLLLENHKLPMAEQKKLLQKSMADWKGDSMQVDDMLVIGFKL